MNNNYKENNYDKDNIVQIFSPLLKKIRSSIEGIDILNEGGHVIEISGSVIKSSIIDVKIGEVCVISCNHKKIFTEVVGFERNCSVLLPYDSIVGISKSSPITSTGSILEAPVGDALIGRILNGFGRPIDNKGPLRTDKFYPIISQTPNPMERSHIKNPLPVGVRSIDGLLTIGKGQRVGIFANAGVGKTTLISCITKNTEADIVVIALIGERGRELKEFLDNDLGPEGLKKAIIICATSDKSPLEISRSAYLATSICEYFRDQGKDVLLIMDSLTRFCRAKRSIALASGESPSRRGYAPSVFDALPKLLERVGNNNKGSISALYTILVEGDDNMDPVAEEARSILDGHIILSRELASLNIYPAIDVSMSISRVMNNIVTEHHLQLNRKIRNIISKYKEIELLLKIGEYTPGSDKDADYAIEHYEKVMKFLVQDLRYIKSFDETIQMMQEIFEE